MTKRILFTIALGVFFTGIVAQNDSIPENAKTDWNFGLLPTITYNSDLGFQYGLLTNIYNYGDGKIYPGYYHSIYAEVSRYTKGSGIYRLFYDSKYFIKGIRTTFDLTYLPDQALDFYGFNGYQAVLNDEWQDDEHANYKTRMFYKHKRNIARAKFDFQGKTKINNINWSAGLVIKNVDISTVDTTRLNKGKDDEDKLPAVNTLYDNYVDWGIIKQDEAEGGFSTTLKAGLVYDTRDNEPNPMKGIWSEAVLAQSFGSEYTFTKLAITHRQYFTLIPKNLSFAYRLGYQGIIAGEAPFFELPNMIYSYWPSATSDGLGGGKNLRGVVRNRVVGNGVVYANLELRWKLVHFKFLKQNVYLALSPFMDFGQVIQEKDVDWTNIDFGVETADDYFNNQSDKLHATYGAGFHFAMNQNFVVSADYGRPLNKQDGNGGLYIGMNFLF